MTSAAVTSTILSIVLQQTPSVRGDKYDFLGNCTSNTLLPDCPYDKYICDNYVTCLTSVQIGREVRSSCPLEQLTLCDCAGGWFDYSRGADPSSYMSLPALAAIEEELHTDPSIDPFVVPAANPYPSKPTSDPSANRPLVMPADPSGPIDPYDPYDWEGPLLMQRPSQQPEQRNVSCRNTMPSFEKPQAIAICGDMPPSCVSSSREYLRVLTISCPAVEIHLCLEENSDFLYIPTGNNLHAGGSHRNSLVWSSFLALMVADLAWI